MTTNSLCTSLSQSPQLGSDTVKQYEIKFVLALSKFHIWVQWGFFFANTFHRPKDSPSTEWSEQKMILDVNDPWFLTSSPNRAPHTHPETPRKTCSDTCSNNVYFIEQSIKFLGLGYNYLGSQFREESGREHYCVLHVCTSTERVWLRLCI